MKNRSTVLWLPAWFPSKHSLLEGDFVERHAKAASLYTNIVILYAVKDTFLKNNHFNIEITKQEGLTIYRGYYNIRNRFNVLEKIASVFFFYQLLFKLYSIAKNEHSKFDLLHLHISQKQGLFAIFLKFVKGIKYVISEHNGWFMPIGDKQFTPSMVLEKIIRLNFKYASKINVVSNSLGKALKNKYPFIKDFFVIPNVVDVSLFYHKEKASNNSDVIFLAITGYWDIKNIDGVIRAFSNFIKKGHAGILRIAGANDANFKILVDELALNHLVKFCGELSNKEIANLMQEMDAFIFFTRYETFGCAMAEALCCGKPVIASRLEVLKENLEEDINGIFVESENENDLTEKLIYFANNKEKFNSKKIAEDAIAKFNFDKVGRDFLALYHDVLKK